MNWFVSDLRFSERLKEKKIEEEEEECNVDDGNEDNE